MKKRLFFLATALLVIAFAGYYYLYKGHRNIAKEAASYQLESSTLAREFTHEPDASLSKYLNKTIAVSGKVTAIEPKGITLNEVVYCEFMEPQPKTLALEQEVSVKGRCIGYDELVTLVKIDQSTIINH